mmetsp:Transcript_49775/g.115521  ORF Transcript_49775/g.115521 Transcript_49775/m.115521 type:complete len:428 (+) Transcript_49775:52-1335(+)|eukprot:CAMPEP_0171060502 /NCGR_PEP_ID=MMETSP0766_2-20121228/3879_1 /TAXON_ID=439317 /ORGANISM="Gambierdiscus australes, Strain CAWD 149" /LENGTH=427 /DNA_ID=CAMNT_0011516095 /DNA_START=43 /DNA_END=1326 /DNA_ORIENTATION=-
MSRVVLLKRPAGRSAVGSSATPRAAKRPAVEDPIVAKCMLVASALEKAEDVPRAARTMLQGMVVTALSVPVEERHRFQATVVEMIGEAFRTLEEGLVAAVAELQSKVDGCGEDKVAREAALVAAEQDLAGLKEASNKQQAALQVEQAALTVAQKELAAAEKVQKQGDARFQEAAERLEKLEGGRTSLLEPVRGGSVSSEGIQEFTNFCDDVNFDRALVQALPLVLKKEPDQRFGFDLVVLDLLEAEFKEVLDKLQTEVQEGAPAKEKRAEAVAAASAAFEQATTRTAAADTAHATAVQALLDGQAALTAAQTAVKQFFPDAKALMDSYDERKAQLSEMRQGFLATFQELRDRSVAPLLADPEAEAANAEPAAAPQPDVMADGAEEVAEAVAPEEAQVPAEAVEAEEPADEAAPEEEPSGSGPAGAAD